jgi:hypothetical protein
MKSYKLPSSLYSRLCLVCMSTLIPILYCLVFCDDDETLKHVLLVTYQALWPLNLCKNVHSASYKLPDI